MPRSSRLISLPLQLACPGYECNGCCYKTMMYSPQVRGLVILGSCLQRPVQALSFDRYACGSETSWMHCFASRLKVIKQRVFGLVPRRHSHHRIWGAENFRLPPRGPDQTVAPVKTIRKTLFRGRGVSLGLAGGVDEFRCELCSQTACRNGTSSRSTSCSTSECSHTMLLRTSIRPRHPVPSQV